MKTIIVAALMGILGAPGLEAQWGWGHGDCGWGRGPYPPAYTPSVLETLAGEILAVERIDSSPGRWTGMHVILKTGAETISVHLGPAWLLERRGFEITPGDKVEVRGSRVPFDGADAIVAAEVKKGKESVRLRDEAGFPVWGGWHHCP